MPNIMTSNLLFIVILCLQQTAIALAATSTRLADNSDDPAFEDYLEFVKRVNHYSPLEGAGSLGSFGINLGLGLQITPRQTTQQPNETLRYLSSQDSGESTWAPRVSFSRGLSIPVNFGIAYARVNNTDVQQWAGFLQWTLFEKLHWPAIAARYTIAKLTGVPEVEITSHSLEGLISYGFLKYFDVFYTYNSHLHISQAHYKTGSLKTQSATISQSSGIQITILPPFTSWAFESQVEADGEHIYYSKVGYLF